VPSIAPAAIKLPSPLTATLQAEVTWPVKDARGKLL
jgi:hypothetical protein